MEPRLTLDQQAPPRSREVGCEEAGSNR